MPLTKVELKFQVEKPIIFQSFSGFSSRGLFYELLRRVDADYAERLHSSARLAPFSATPILISTSKGWRVVYDRLPALALCMVGFTLFDREITSRIWEALVDGCTLRIQDVEVSPLEVSVSQESYSRFLAEAKPVRSFSVEFITPTYFRFSPYLASRLFPSRRPAGGVSDKRIRRARRFHPLPEPITMMRSLVRLWNEFADISFNYRRYLSWIMAMGISLSGFPKGIRTRRLYEHRTTGKFVVGFQGIVHFSVPDDLYLKRWARITDALLKFAEYSNVGGGRTAGLGMVRYLPKEYEDAQ